MLLTGTYERSLDEKQRLALPKPFRDVFAHAKQLLLTPGTDGSLALFSGDAFAVLAEKLAMRSPTAQDTRAFSRLLYSQSRAVEIDSQGRIRIAAELAELAQLRGDVVLIGVGDHLELWNKPRWAAYFAEQQSRYDLLAEAALSEGPGPAPNEKVGPPNGAWLRQSTHPK